MKKIAKIAFIKIKKIYSVEYIAKDEKISHRPGKNICKMHI